MQTLSQVLWVLYSNSATSCLALCVFELNPGVTGYFTPPKILYPPTKYPRIAQLCFNAQQHLFWIFSLVLEDPINKSEILPPPSQYILLSQPLPQWQYTGMTMFESLFLATFCFLKLGNGESTFFSKHCTRWLRIFVWSKTTSSMLLPAAMWNAVAIVKIPQSQEPLCCCMMIHE